MISNYDQNFFWEKGMNDLENVYLMTYLDN